MTAADGVQSFYARAVFFVSDGQRALEFYTQKLGFKLDWKQEEGGRAWVFQVSLHGFELIVNQDEPWHEGRVGHGRVFLSLNGYRFAPDEARTVLIILAAAASEIDETSLAKWFADSSAPK